MSGEAMQHGCLERLGRARSHLGGAVEHAWLGFLERLGWAQSRKGGKAVKPGVPKRLGTLDRLEAERSRRLKASMRMIMAWVLSGSGR
jgi:hypothetical protein